MALLANNPSLFSRPNFAGAVTVVHGLLPRSISIISA
jgi:hypothetical protein